MPGSTLRVRTTPSDGARIEALDRLISSVESAACASATLARAGLVGDGAVERRAAGVELGCRRHLAAGQPRHLLQPRQVGARLLLRRDGLRHLGVRRGERRARAQDLVAQLGGVELDQHLPLAHAVVDVDVDLLHRARELAADVDRARRLQGAVGGDGQREPAARHRLRDVARQRARALPRLPPGPARDGRQHQQQQAAPERGAARPGARRRLGEQRLQVGLGLRRRDGRGRRRAVHERGTSRAAPAAAASGCQPPPSAVYSRTWSAPTSARAPATASCVLSWVRGVSSTGWKSTSPLR